MPIIKSILFLFIISLISCQTSIVQQRDKEYLKATTLPPLHQPPGITLHTIRSDYAIAEKSYPPSAKEVSLLPPGL